MSRANEIETANNNLYENIRTVLDEARNKISRVVNFTIVDAYWNIGRMIVEEEQNGADRANYGEYLIKDLSQKLTEEFGKGLSVTNLKNMRKFYQAFSKRQTLSDQLSWSHYLVLSKIEEADKRELIYRRKIGNKKL